MKKIILSLLFSTAFLTLIKAQDISSLKAMQPEETYDNITAKKIFSDKYTTSSVIWIKKEVKPHKHLKHTEQVYIIEGKAKMTLGEKEIEVQKGDWITIPEGTTHAVIVTSKKPLKVLSVQTPQFKGKDRVFINK